MFSDPDEALTTYAAPAADGGKSVGGPAGSASSTGAADCGPLYPLPSFPKERQGGADIFVGGGGDDLPGFGVMRDYAQAYAKQTGRPVLYLPNDRPGQLMDAIRSANASDGPVNLVGHSWGPSDAYNAAAAAKQQGLRVDNLITLDPVGGNFGLANPHGAPGADNWINIEAKSPGGTSGDLAALLGGKPSTLPIDQANQRIVVPAHHEDVDVMMSQGGRQILDQSRALPQSGDGRDESPTWDWMQRRNAARPVPR